MLVIMGAFIVGMLLGALRRGGRGGLPRRSAPRNDRGACIEPPVKFHTAEMSFVRCRAERARSLADVDIYGERVGKIERQELAYTLADQLLAAGGIRFYEENGVLRGEVKAVVPE